MTLDAISSRESSGTLPCSFLNELAKTTSSLNPFRPVPTELIGRLTHIIRQGKVMEAITTSLIYTSLASCLLKDPSIALHHVVSRWLLAHHLAHGSKRVGQTIMNSPKSRY